MRISLTKQQENVLEIDHLQNDGVKYDPQRFATLILAEIAKTTCANFLFGVKAERAKWIKVPATFDMPQCITNLTKLYTNYKHTGIWDKSTPNPKAQLIALATQLWKEIKDNKGGKRN